MKKDINLLEVYVKGTKKKATQYSRNKIYTIIGLVTFLLLATYTAKLYVEDLGYQNEIHNLNSYLNSTEIVKSMETVTGLQSKIKQLETLKADLVDVNKVLVAIPRFDSVPLAIIYNNRPGNSRLELISVENSQIILQLSVDHPADLSAYVLALINIQYFEAVTYDGYTYDTDTRLYRSNVQCWMKGE